MGLERINDLRKGRDLTIEDLSEKSGVPVSTLKKICAGTTVNPALETVKSIARALDCSLSEFDDTKKAPAQLPELHGDLVSTEDLTRLLVNLGFIRDGEDLTDEDFAFLSNVVGLLDAWFSKRG